jgi:type III pantothenate kinase
MSLNLCIDWGNTNVKAAIIADDKIQHQVTFNAENALEEISGLLEKYSPAKAILCAVTEKSGEVAHLLKSKLPMTVVMEGDTNVPINNAYLSQETLGPDRLALVNAAHFAYPDKNNLVVSLGTCITYNLVQKNKTFRGGAISPGLHMRLKAMTAFTDKLPEVKVLDDDPLLLGYDTDTCLQSGAANGMAAEIDGMVKAYEDRYPDFNAILTGGDAPYFATKLKSKIFADPDLLLKGLNLILNHNVPLPR